MMYMYVPCFSYVHGTAVVSPKVTDEATSLLERSMKRRIAKTVPTPKRNGEPCLDQTVDLNTSHNIHCVDNHCYWPTCMPLLLIFHS